MTLIYEILRFKLNLFIVLKFSLNIKYQVKKSDYSIIVDFIRELIIRMINNETTQYLND